MKKLFILFVMLPFMAVSTNAQPLFDRGDVNGDGVVDISDVVLVVNIVLDGDVHLTCPDSHHPHLIDLGLPSGTLWSCCNVGANTPEAYGGYYAWGETEGKLKYNWSNYIHSDGKQGTSHNLGSDIAGTKYDVAHIRWGRDWRMPTREQRDELVDNCTFEWTTINGIYGGKFTSKTNGGSIFLPAAGMGWGDEFKFASSRGYYWTSTINTSDSDFASYLYFDSNGATLNGGHRYAGRCIRPVVKK